MIRSICRYYLWFPPITRLAIDVSFKGFLGFIGIDITSAPEDILLDIDATINKKLI